MGLSNPSRETKFSGADRDREKTNKNSSADHEQDWQPYPRLIINLAICDDHTYIHT